MDCFTKTTQSDNTSPLLLNDMLWEYLYFDSSIYALGFTRDPQPRISITLITGTGVYLGLGFHNFRVLCAKRTHILAYLSPIIKDSFEGPF